MKSKVISYKLLLIISCWSGLSPRDDYLQETVVKFGYFKSVELVSFSSDGKNLVTIILDNTAKLW